MRNGGALHRNRDEVLLGIFHTLTDGFRHFGSFAHAHANFAIFVADNNQSREGETTSAFDDFSYAVNEDDSFFEAVILFSN